MYRGLFMCWAWPRGKQLLIRAWDGESRCQKRYGAAARKNGSRSLDSLEVDELNSLAPRFLFRLDFRLLNPADHNFDTVCPE